MEFLEVPFFDDDVFKLLVRLLINLLVVAIVILGCYRKHQNNETYIFTFMILNIMVFFICFALKKLELELGLALGLFAIFGIIRYRTESIGVHEMTYLFVVVGIAVINSLSNKKTSYLELAVTNGFIIVATCVMEIWLTSKLKNGNRVPISGNSKKAGKAKDKKVFTKQSVIYDNLELLGPERRDELAKDIEKRTGLVAQRIEIAKIDLPQGVATLNLYMANATEPRDPTE